jgi:hypothetical protein
MKWGVERKVSNGFEINVLSVQYSLKEVKV